MVLVLVAASGVDVGFDLDLSDPGKAYRIDGDREPVVAHRHVRVTDESLS